MHRMAQCQSTITCRNSNDSVSALTPCDKYDRKKIKCKTDMTAHISAGFHKIQSEHEFHIFVWLLFFFVLLLFFRHRALNLFLLCLFSLCIIFDLPFLVVHIGQIQSPLPLQFRYRGRRPRHIGPHQRDKKRFSTVEYLRSSVLL